MGWFVGRVRQLRALAFKRDVERELDDEVGFHVAMEIEKNMRDGLGADEARRRALIAFGGVERYKESVREARGTRFVEDFGRDMRLAQRTLIRSPGFSVIAILTLGLGLGTVTAVFALVNRILLQPLPYPDAERLVALKHVAPGLGLAEAGLSSGTYFHYREHARTLERLAVYGETVLNLKGSEGTERVQVTRAGPELFDVLGARPEIGRLFSAAESNALEQVARGGGTIDGRTMRPILLSYGFWQRRFGGDRGIIGRILTINDNPREVVGVLPAGFAFPSPNTEIWVLFAPPAVSANFAHSLSYSAVARLRAGVTPAAARLELTAILPRIVGSYSDATPERLAEVQLKPIVVALKDEVIGDIGPTLWILLGGMACLLLVASSNIANLFLLRSEHRRREVAVRTALGARRSDLARLFITEAVIISAAGAVLGYVLTGWMLATLLRVLPVELPRAHEVRVDGWAVGVMSLLAALTAVFIGLLSMMRQLRIGSLNPTLKSGTRSATEGRDQSRAQQVLVAAQVAIALVLLVGSALMVQSFLALMRVHPGFDAPGLLTVDIGLPYRKAGEHKRVYDGLVERVNAVPGVRAAAAASSLPLDGGGYDYPVRAVDPDARDGEINQPVHVKFITSGFLRVMGTAITEGTDFTASEHFTVANPVIVSASLARRLFPGESAVGREIMRLEEDGSEVTLFDAAVRVARTVPPYTIAGIAADVRETSLRGEPDDIVYVPVLIPPVERSIVPTEMTLVIRTNLPPLSLSDEVRSAIMQTDADVSVARIRTMDDVVAASTAKESFLAALLMIASAGSLFLGCVGIYGVVASVVRRRTREIGIRMAIGARASQIAGMVLSGSLATVVVGAIFGVAASLLLTRVLRSLLFHVSPTDPLTLFGAATLLLATALLASVLPALRAARLDPTIALHTE